MRAGQPDTGTANCALSHCLPMRLSPRRKNTFLCCAPRISFRRCVCRMSWRPVQKGWRPLLRMEDCALSAALYKEFVLRHGGVWAALIEFVKTHAKACVDQGAPLRVIVTAEERKRNAEQNRYYWSAVLQHIAEHAEVGGRR